MKRVSPLLGVGINTAQPTRKYDKDTVPIEIMRRTQTLKDGKPAVFDFTILLKFGCNSDGHAIESRRQYVYKLAKKFNAQFKDRKPVSTLHDLYRTFRTYIRFCDKNGLDPFTKQGYRAYVGNTGELRRLIALQNEQLHHLYLFQDGQEMGISETTATSVRCSIRKLLQWSGVYHGGWDIGVKTIGHGDVKSHKPYSATEQDKTISRLSFFFNDLCEQLIEFSEANPNTPLPRSLSVKIGVKTNGEATTIEVGKQTSKQKHDLQSPFNRAMQAGYYLFCYYTSLNTSPILEVCHPIDVVTEKKESRTIKHATVRGFKGRANKTVAALFSDYSGVADIPLVDADGDEAGAITAVVEKTHGIAFIKLLAKLSRLHQTEEYGKLFYQLDPNNNIKRFETKTNLSELLGLLSDERFKTTDRLIENFLMLLYKGERYEVSTPNSGALGQIVTKKKVKLPKRGIILNISYCAYGAVRSMTDVELKNIIMPLSYGDLDEDGDITISFAYKDGSSGSFKVNSKYKDFFVALERYALTRNPIKTAPDKYNPNTPPRPAYLLPIRSKLRTKQWDCLEHVSASYLKKLGVLHGEFFLALNASRFRKTTADEEFNPNDSGYRGAQILSNELETFQQSYANGHPEQNKLIQSQGIQVLEEHATTQDLQEAKTNVKLRLKIEVLEHDEWKSLSMPTNINGVFCNGKPEIVGGKNEHRAAIKFAEDILDIDIEKIQCYQYDQCVDCKSARLVNDVHAVYKFLSFVQLIEDLVDRIPKQMNRLTERAEYLKAVVEQSISLEILDKAEDMLFENGVYPLMTEDYVYAMLGDINA